MQESQAAASDLDWGVEDSSKPRRACLVTLPHRDQDTSSDGHKLVALAMSITMYQCWPTHASGLWPEGILLPSLPDKACGAAGSFPMVVGCAG